MAREKLKDWTGKIIGFKEQLGSRLWLYVFYGRKLGYYDSTTNKTYEWTGGQSIKLFENGCHDEEFVLS